VDKALFSISWDINPVGHNPCCEKKECSHGEEMILYKAERRRQRSDIEISIKMKNN